MKVTIEVNKGTVLWSHFWEELLATASKFTSNGKKTPAEEDKVSMLITLDPHSTVKSVGLTIKRNNWKVEAGEWCDKLHFTNTTF